MKWYYSYWKTAPVILMLALLAGCDFHVSNGNVPEKLKILKEKFGVAWPQSYTNEQGGSLTDDRGDSDIVVKLEVTESNYMAWRQSATNILHDSGFMHVSVGDPKLEKHFPWWDCSSLPKWQLRWFANDMSASNPNGLLFVYVFTTNKTAIMYIDGSPK
jgi:hypothetical protein